MRQCAKTCFFVVSVALVFLVAFVFPVAADIELTDLSWTMNGTSEVRFHVQFYNPDQSSNSGAATAALYSQPFGAFVEDYGLIKNFDIPPIEPESFFDVYYDVPLMDLPPSAEKITPWGGGGGGGAGVAPEITVVCPPDLFWAGNVDLWWSGDGGSGQVNAHYGTIQVCPGGASSFIHIFGNCPTGVSWAFGALCSGWFATLMSSDGMGLPDGPAPNPFPAGNFDGWIKITADGTVSTGSTCCFTLNMTCGASTVPINICTEACECTVPAEESSWGTVKSLYQ
jgi:hypothetical protein